MPEESTQEIVVERNLIIPLSDGAELSADLYRPAGANRFPALLSFYPYHKDDFIGAMTDEARRYFASHGYASLLIDFRGLGGSSGVAWDAMDRGEGRDGAEAVEWIARQNWCDGNVGMWGLSYGGISSLKVAAENPPHLKAIAPIQGTVDLFHDYIGPGGCPSMLGSYGAWGSFMLAMNLMPPTNADSKGRWYKAWLQRLEQGTPFVMPWVEHRTFDEFWSAKAVDPAKIKVPTFIIGGWRDIFPNGMPDVYARLRCVKKLWMGPWMHTMPANSPYEPLDHLHELKRWFDRWLRGEKNGIENEPPVLLNVQRANVWKHEREWPIERASMRTLNLSSTGALTQETQREEQAETYIANQSIGTAAGLWDPMGLGVGAPLDQTSDDLQSLSYTSEPMDEDTEISGAPDARIFCEVKSGDDVNLVVKLCDVDPSGASLLITTGWLRGTCRNSTARAEPLPHDEAIEFRVPMWATSYSVAKGNRIRVSISCADFPHLWPTRTNPEIRVHFGGHRASSIAIPIVPAPKQPIEGPPIRRAPIQPRPTSFVPIWKIERDLVSGNVAVTTGEKNAFPLPQGGRAEVDHVAVARVTPSRPEGATVEGDTTIRVQAPVIGNMEVVTSARVIQDAISLGSRIFVDGRLIFEKRWQK